MKIVITISLLSIVTLSGCATITGSSMQPVAVTAKTIQGQYLTNVDCTLRNEKGKWRVLAPNSVSVRKASGDLSVECTQIGQPNGRLRAVSRAGAGMYGNILIGGGIGAVIDHSRGTAYNYPNNLPVVMGASMTVDRRNSK